MTTKNYFRGFEPSAKKLKDQMKEIGIFKIKVTTSRIAFCKKHAFAYVWIPDKYLKGNHAPLVLSVPLLHRDNSLRWKEIVHPTTKWFMHHLELNAKEDIDAQVLDWIALAKKQRG